MTAQSNNCDRFILRPALCERRRNNILRHRVFLSCWFFLNHFWFYPQAVEHFLAALQKVGTDKQQYYAYWLARLIPSLPKAAAARIEALLPGLDEKMVDQIAPYLAELQAKR